MTASFESITIRGFTHHGSATPWEQRTTLVPLPSYNSKIPMVLDGPALMFGQWMNFVEI